MISKRMMLWLAGLCMACLFAAVDAFAQQTPDKYFSANIGGQTRYAKEASSLAQQALADPSYAQCGTSDDKCYWTFKECKPWTGSQWTCTALKQYYDGSPAPTELGILNPFVNTCTTAKPWFEPSIGGCSDKPPQKTCDAGKTGSGQWKDGPTGAPPPSTSVATTGGCVDGCMVQMTDVQRCGSYTDGFNYCTYGYKTTGGVCAAGSGGPAPSTPPTTSNPPRVDVPPFKAPPGSSCPAGTVQAGTDSAGTPICMGTGSDPKNSPPPPPKIESEKTTTNSDGSVTTTKTTTTTNADGSTTTVIENVTKMPDGSTKTDTSKNTSDKPSGGAGKDDSAKDNEKYDLCKQNPMLTICRNSSVSGRCGEISCEGDAIQCATLRAAAAMQCQQDDDKKALEQSPMKTLGQQIIDGADPMKGQIDAAFKGREVDMSKQALDDAGFVGAGSCFPDKSINVMGKTITVSFARVCQDIQPLRAAIMACAFIVAYLIVSKSVLQG